MTLQLGRRARVGPWAELRSILPLPSLCSCPVRSDPPHHSVLGLPRMSPLLRAFPVTDSKCISKALRQDQLLRLWD